MLGADKHKAGASTRALEGVEAELVGGDWGANHFVNARPELVFCFILFNTFCLAYYYGNLTSYYSATEHK